jgi:hypothetical protein
VNVNNNYYNRFNNTNVSTLPANNRSAYNNNAATLPANQVPQNNQSNWKGQSTYQGARPTTTQGQKSGASMANAVPRNEQYGQRRNNQMTANRPNAGNPSSTNPATNRGNAGNVGGSNLAGNRGNAGNAGASNLPANRPNTANAGTMNRGGDRGYPPLRPRRAPRLRPLVRILHPALLHRIGRMRGEVPEPSAVGTQEMPGRSGRPAIEVAPAWARRVQVLVRGADASPPRNRRTNSNCGERSCSRS